MSKKKEDPTLVDKIWSKIENNRYLAFAIVLGSIVIGLSAFSESFLNLFRTANDFIPSKQKTGTLNSSKQAFVSNYQDYFNSNFQVASDQESDIVNLSKDDIAIDFSVNDSSSKYFKYVLKDSNGQYIINPYDNYLSLLSKGGPITPKDGPGFDYPVLHFKTVNNSGKSIFFTRAIFRVSQSKSDPFPIIAVHNGEAMSFFIENHGWGKVQNCKVVFRIKPIENNSSTDSSTKGEINVGDFDQSGFVSLVKYFKNMGVRVPDSINSGQVTLWREEDWGPFHSGRAKVFGEIYYEGINVKGDISKEKVQFETEVDFREFDGEGVPDGKIYDVELESDKSNYVKTVSISQGTKTGDFDRFNIKIAAPKSSRHQFDLLLLYNNNKQFIIPNISLNYFMPRNLANLIEEKK
jgi:hypothetical protein